MRYFIFWLRFLLLLPFLSVYDIQGTLSLSASNSSKHLCHHKDGTALHHFIRDFIIDSSASFTCQTAYPKIRSWNGNTDCCSWDGVLCDSLSGHVIELDLSCAQILGTIDSKSSLFQLQQLQSLNLAFNDFYNSPISPKIGKFSHLRYLNLSSAGFSGIVPTEIADLSQLISLDLSNVFQGNTLELSDLALITESMPELTQLHLRRVSIINSVIPPSLANLTALSSLVLYECGLQGNFPLAEILQLPHIRNLNIFDEGLCGNFSGISWIGPLEVLILSSPGFTGRLPESPGPTQFLRELKLSGCNFYGVIPHWVWNTTETIELYQNQFSGGLPSLLNTSKLSKIDSIRLFSNNLSGKIPPWLFTLPSLLDLDLSYNQFSGQLVIENFNPRKSSWDFDSSTKYEVYESNRKLASGRTDLRYLNLGSNNLNGTIDFSVFYKFPNLYSLVLSNNSLSLFFNDGTPTQTPQINALGLSSCNLGKFPNFLIDQYYLQLLELSDNNIHGQIPRWFLEKKMLTYLDLSHNYLTGGLENIRWYNLTTIDLRYNMFKGLLPGLNLDVSLYLVSNNKFTGEIPSTVCSNIYLQALDLSNNSLTGQIPQCLGNMSNQLIILNLWSNKFQGTFQVNFTSTCALEVMNINKNQLEGPITPSICNCSSLKVLDLGNNMLSDTFPHWLGTLTKLEVLVLRSNKLKGPLVTELDVESQFPKLRILDISNNQFSGNFSHKLIKSLKGMMNKSEGDGVQYMGEGNYYKYSIVLTFKGYDHYIAKVLSVLATIDVSNNKFNGDVSDAIGDLVSLRWLNLSHNNFSGIIPSSLSNLVMLESFDISSNELEGQIPKELVGLTSLEVFNVSRNQLVGPIPVGRQFDTFENNSYLENVGLCGTPLSKKCRDDGDAVTKQPPTEFHDSIDISVWETALMGYGCGMILGLVVGCLVFLFRTPFCLSRLIYRVEFIMEQHFKRRRRRQRRRST